MYGSSSQHAPRIGSIMHTAVDLVGNLPISARSYAVQPVLTRTALQLYIGTVVVLLLGPTGGAG